MLGQCTCTFINLFPGPVQAHCRDSCGNGARICFLAGIGIEMWLKVHRKQNPGSLLLSFSHVLQTSWSYLFNFFNESCEKWPKKNLLNFVLSFNNVSTIYLVYINLYTMFGCVCVCMCTQLCLNPCWCVQHSHQFGSCFRLNFCHIVFSNSNI